MARRIEHSLDYAASVAAVHAALVDEDYWHARVAAVGGAGATLDAVEATDGGISVRLTQRIAAEHLPSIVRKVKSGDLTVARTETWGRCADARAAGDFSVLIAGTPITMRGTHTLSGGDGESGGDAQCTVATTGQAQVSVPLIGGKIEQVIAENITRLLELEHQFTAQWLADHG